MTSSPSHEHALDVEKLINYLTIFNVEKSDIKDLETLVSEVMTSTRDTELSKVIRAFGWSGTKFNATKQISFDARDLLQSLSNLYLRQKNISKFRSTSFFDSCSMGNSTGWEHLLSFCPDMLVNELWKSRNINNPSGVRCLTFMGACMLVDISGFSKFSGAMCSQGVNGLDELRKATNGFLGHFVETVYAYKGDGKNVLLHVYLNYM